MDVVIRTSHGEAEITIARAGDAIALADIIECVTGSASPPIADVDGRAVLTTTTLNASALLSGSVIDLGPPLRAPPNDAVLELVQVAGWGAGARQALGPGMYRVGPGRRVNAPDLDIAHVDKVAFELSIDSAGGAVVTVDEHAVRIDGIVVEGSAPWDAGILDVAGRAFELDHAVGRADRPHRTTGGATSGTIVFNRPPRPARRPAPPPLERPAVVDEVGEARRSTRHNRRRQDGPAGSDQLALSAFQSGLAARRDDERRRRHAVFPHIAGAVALAADTSPRLWSTRPGDADAFEFAIGLGDIEWSPELASATGTPADPASVIADLGRLAMAPVTVALRDERGMAFVGASEFTRAAVRGLLIEACVQHGPADLDVVVLTDPDRAPVWEWVKWLPHSRTSGNAQVLVALDQIDAWAAEIRDGPRIVPHPSHLTLAVVDEAAWWRDRVAPMRPVMNDATRPVRFVILAETANDVPNLCTTLVSEQAGDLARVEWLGDGTVVDDVQLFLLGTAVAAATARRLAPLDDPELAVPVTSTLPLSVPIPQLLGQANLTASPLTAHWRATSERPVAVVPIGVTHRETVEVDLERDGPHTLIGGSAGSGKSELLRTMVMGLAAGLPPDAITFALLDLAGLSTFVPCASLPHVVMHHNASEPHLAERAVRSLQAELRGRDDKTLNGDASPGLVIVVDEPAALASEHPHLVASLIEIAADGQRLGIHLIVATEHPSVVLDRAGPAAFGLRIALRLSDERESEALIGTPEATRLPRRISGRGLVRFGDSEPVEFQAAMVSAASSPGTTHDLELRPYVVGRELTPMELRVLREANGNASGGGAGRGNHNDISRLVGEITAAAVAVGQARPRRLGPEPLPHVLERRLLDVGLSGRGVPFALVDLPDQQRQQIRWWEPGADGSLLIYGTEGAGTSAALASLAIGAAERYSPDDFHLYVVDAGGLAPLATLPHTGAVVCHDDVGRIAELVDVVASEIDRRASATSDDRSLVPQIAVMIDDVGALRHQLRDRAGHDRARDDHAADERAEYRSEGDDVWAAIAHIVRDGPAVGVCTVATAKRERDVPAGFAAQIPSRLVMRLAEPSAYASFGFRPIDVPWFVPGRALDPADRCEVQLVEPPASLADAVAAIAAEPARVRPPLPVEANSA
jgi:S-DNA-T family DNA segregation ATPase FtsK/SpoIIIE